MLSFLASLGLAIVASQASLLPIQSQGLVAARPAEVVLSNFADHGSTWIRVATIDCVVLVCYVVFFSGIFAAMRSRAPVLAYLGLTLGLLGAAFDAAENAHTLMLAFNGTQSLGLPAAEWLSRFYLLTFSKWLALSAAFIFFAAGLRRDSWLEKAVVLVGLAFATSGVLGFGWPLFAAARNFLIWIAMPLLALLFWRYAKADGAGAV